jgi:YVTN family beta-propeller protein
MKRILFFFSIVLLVLSNHAFSASEQTVAYVNQGGDCSVAIIDLKTHQIVDTIPIDPNSTRKSCIIESVVSPEKDRLYAIKADEHKKEDQCVYVYDLKTRALIKSIVVSEPPLKFPLANIIMTPDGSHVYVSTYGSSSRDAIWDIDTRTLEPSRIWLGSRSGPMDMLMSPDGKKLYVATRGANTITIIDTSSDTVIGTMYQADGWKMFLSRDGKTLYANWNDLLWAFDTTTYQKLWQKQLPVPTGLSPAISADYKTLYASPNHSKLQGVFAIDIETLSLTKLNPITDTLWGVAPTLDGKWIYLSDYESGELLEMDAKTGEIKIRAGGLVKPEGLYLL